MRPDFTVVKKGYDINEVDEYIDELENIVKEYQEKDNAIKNALINAEMSVDNLLKNAKVNAAQILEDAELESKHIIKTTKSKATTYSKEITSTIQNNVGNANNHLDEILGSIADQKKMLSAFQKDYDAIINKYLKNIDSDEYLSTFDKICSLEDSIESLKVVDNKNPFTKNSYNSSTSSQNVDENSDIDESDISDKAFSSVEKNNSDLSTENDDVIDNDDSNSDNQNVNANPMLDNSSQYDKSLNQSYSDSDDNDTNNFADTITEVDAKSIINSMEQSKKSNEDIISKLQKASGGNPQYNKSISDDNKPEFDLW